jgi:hypothetical protein
VKDLKKRLDRLERQIAPPQIICILSSPTNRQLVADGFLPALPTSPEGVAGRRLLKSDIVVFLLEAEMCL